MFYHLCNISSANYSLKLKTGNSYVKPFCSEFVTIQKEKYFTAGLHSVMMIHLLSGSESPPDSSLFIHDDLL